MAKSTSTKKKTTKKSTGRTTKKEREALEQARRQLAAILLFAGGVFFVALTLIEGVSFWKTLHNLMFGLFGFAAYLIAPIMLYLAYLASGDKPMGSISAKLWQVAAVLIAICALLQISGAGLPTVKGFESITYELFENGVNFKGGGLAGAVMGLPFYALFGKLGATIVTGILLFVFIMVLTGSTLYDLYKTATKPVKKLEEAYVSTAQRIKEENEKEEKTPPAYSGTGRRAAIDIPLNDQKPVKHVEEPEILPVVNKTTLVQPQPEEVKPAAQAQPAVNPELDELVKKALAGQEATAKEKSAEPADVKTAQAAIEKELENKEENKKQYTFPPIDFLNGDNGRYKKISNEELQAKGQLLQDTLESFGVKTKIINIAAGPAVTRYELQPAAGVKINRITNLVDDIALNLAASGVRIEAPIPGKAAVGIEVPNQTVNMVTLREIIESREFKTSKKPLSVAMGRDIAGSVVVSDLAKMPHVLIAGATGSGKSVCINSIIMSLIYKSSDKDVKLIMIDPKVVELGVYNGIPHLLLPVVTDPKKAAGALNWSVGEMLKRYKLFAEVGVRDLESYNTIARESDELETMPHIVIIVDELSDLMSVAPNDVENAICRLAQMARAAGMHLVIATQRPSVDVITGVIKANIPSRIAFAVSSQVDSRTILDSSGAEKLLGRGDMLFNPVGAFKPTRVQACFVSDKEVERVVAFVKEGAEQNYSDEIMSDIEKLAPQDKNSASSRSSADNDDFGNDKDELLLEAIESVVETGTASTSYLQRRFRVGYSRAGRLIDEMERMGIIGPYEGSKPRKVLISKDQYYEMKLSGSLEGESTQTNEV